MGLLGMVVIASVAVTSLVLTYIAGGNWLDEKPLLHFDLEQPHDRFQDPRVKKDAASYCLECQLLVSLLKTEMALGMSYNTMVDQAVTLCTMESGFTPTFCEGYIPSVAPIINHIFRHNTVDSEDACGVLLSILGCTNTNPARNWSVMVQGEKPPVKPLRLPKDTTATVKVLHISDTHLDPLYTPGSNAACPEELCCREDSGIVEEEGGEAWYWGDYRHCDAPPWMLESMLEHVRSKHPDVSYVIWTGDVVPHNIWSTSKEWNLRVVRETNNMIRKWFPDVPVFPAVGNHEMSPVDMFPNPGTIPEELSAMWLYEELAAQWSLLIPDLDDTTVLKAGFYSVLVKPGFRIISFNSMFSYTVNAWLVEDSHDPAGELAWLEEELSKAEAAGELVHLLGHIPPGLLVQERTWSREYNNIVLRYENTIRGQFFGHTHHDEFEVFHDGDRPFSVAYIAPSQTPWYGLNPAYRIYHVDGDRPDTTRMVLDHETYVMNLTEAHVTGEARWYQLYSARHQYGLADLTPSAWQDLAQRMAVDRDLFDLYYTNFVSGGDPFMAKGCDDVCRQQRLCGVVSSNRTDLDHCFKILQMMHVS